MSEENVERMHRAFDAFTRHNKVAWLELCDPDLEWAPVDDWPKTRPIRGREAVWDYIVATDEPWERGTYEAVEVVDKVVSHLRVLAASLILALRRSGRLDAASDMRLLGTKSSSEGAR